MTERGCLAIFETIQLQTIYWAALAVGLGALVLALLFGDVFDFLDLDVGGTDLSVVPVLFTAVAAFGAGGLIGIEAFGFGQGGSIITGIGTGIAGGGLAAGLFLALRRQEAKPAFELSQLVGQRGRATVGIGPGRVGRVTVTHDGMTRAFPASSTDEISTGDEIVVIDVIGSQLSVAKPSADTPR